MTTINTKKPSIIRWFAGLLISSVFSLVYFVSPFYVLTVIPTLLLQFPSKQISLIYAIPFFVSILIPATPMLWLAKFMTPMLDYFQYEEILEISNEELMKTAEQDGKRYILAMVPHGVVSFTSISSWVNAPYELRGIKTAAASVLLKFPILKNVMGIFGLTPADSKNLLRIFRNEKGIDGSIVLYVGGIAELFKSCRTEERLYLKERKGFIKIALREGVDIIPVYLFGNTSIFTVVKHGFLADLSRKLQMSLTYFWGQCMLPIPRSEKLVYCRGKPLGLPHIPNPTDEDVLKWHDKYCEEVSRLFNNYKEKLPAYKHKSLIID